MSYVHLDRSSAVHTGCDSTASTNGLPLFSASMMAPNTSGFNSCTTCRHVSTCDVKNTTCGTAYHPLHVLFLVHRDKIAPQEHTSHSWELDEPPHNIRALGICQRSVHLRKCGSAQPLTEHSSHIRQYTPSPHHSHKPGRFRTPRREQLCFREGTSCCLGWGCPRLG